MEEDTRPGPSTIQAESDSQFYKHIIAIYTRSREETGGRCRGPPSEACLFCPEETETPRTETHFGGTWGDGWELARQGWEVGTP